MASKCRWIPLESNPEVLNKYLGGIGVASDWQFHDILGLDDELLQMLPSPVRAVVMLYPLTDKTDTKIIGDPDKDASDVYFMEQTIGNACGTVALVHALANNDDIINFDEDKAFFKFLKDSKDLSPKERGDKLEEDKDMGLAHEENAQEGDTEAPDRDTKINKHFVAFVSKNGNLYELDGRKKNPVNHGKAKEGDFEFLQKTAAVVKQFMARDPEEVNFTLLALCKC